jgi:hypothetical protein
MSVDQRTSNKTFVLPALDDQQRIDADLTSDVDVSTD